VVIEIDDKLKEEIKGQFDRNKLQFAVFRAVRGLTELEGEEAKKVIEGVRAAITDEP